MNPRKIVEKKTGTLVHAGSGDDITSGNGKVSGVSPQSSPMDVI